MKEKFLTGFKLKSPFKPTGDQSLVIKKIVKNLKIIQDRRCKIQSRYLKNIV